MTTSRWVLSRTSACLASALTSVKIEKRSGTTYSPSKSKSSGSKSPEVGAPRRLILSTSLFNASLQTDWDSTDHKTSKTMSGSRTTTGRNSIRRRSRLRLSHPKARTISTPSTPTPSGRTPTQSRCRNLSLSLNDRASKSCSKATIMTRQSHRCRKKTSLPPLSSRNSSRFRRRRPRVGRIYSNRTRPPTIQIMRCPR